MKDDPAQFAAAKAFLENELSAESPGFVSLVVVCELAWALSRAYGLERAPIADTIAELAATPQLTIEAVEVVSSAAAQTRFDIADAIIHLAGRRQGCETTVTFDRKFAKMKGVRMLA